MESLHFNEDFSCAKEDELSIGSSDVFPNDSNSVMTKGCFSTTTSLVSNEPPQDQLDPFYPQCLITEADAAMTINEMVAEAIKEEPQEGTGINLDAFAVEVGACFQGDLPMEENSMENMKSEFAASKSAEHRGQENSSVILSEEDNSSSLTMVLRQSGRGSRSPFNPSDKYVCCFCIFSCSNKTIFKEHLLKHVNSAQIDDLMDSLTSEADQAMDEDCSNTGHGAVGSGGRPINQCTFCDYNTPRKYRLREHMARHTGEGVLNCPLCDFKATRKDKFKMHLKKHGVSSEGIFRILTPLQDRQSPSIKRVTEEGHVVFECPACMHKIKRKYRFKVHLEQHVTDGTLQADVLPRINSYASYAADPPRKRPKKEDVAEGGLFQCTDCDYSTDRRYRLKEHAQRHTGEASIKCPYCDYQTARKDKLKEHLSKHTGEGLLKCNVCSYTTTRNYRLREHMVTHTGEGISKCTKCDYKTNRKDNFKEHMNKHETEREFVCKDCDYTTFLQKTFERHLLSHTADGKLSCPYCEYNATRRDNFKQHLAMHRGDRSHKCSQCEYSTVYKKCLEYHVASMHTGLKKIACPLCNKTYNRNDRFKQHFSTHTGADMYKCETCGFSTSWRDSFHRHVATHKGKEEQPLVSTDGVPQQPSLPADGISQELQESCDRISREFRLDGITQEPIHSSDEHSREHHQPSDGSTKDSHQVLDYIIDGYHNLSNKITPHPNQSRNGTATQNLHRPSDRLNTHEPHRLSDRNAEDSYQLSDGIRSHSITQEIYRSNRDPHEPNESAGRITQELQQVSDRITQEFRLHQPVERIQQDSRLPTNMVMEPFQLLSDLQDYQLRTNMVSQPSHLSAYRNAIDSHLSSDRFKLDMLLPTDVAKMASYIQLDHITQQTFLTSERISHQSHPSSDRLSQQLHIPSDGVTHQTYHLNPDTVPPHHHYLPQDRQAEQLLSHDLLSPHHPMSIS